jgi:hypothetical protein
MQSIESRMTKWRVSRSALDSIDHVGNAAQAYEQGSLSRKDHHAEDGGEMPLHKIVLCNHYCNIHLTTFR